MSPHTQTAFFCLVHCVSTCRFRYKQLLRQLHTLVVVVAVAVMTAFWQLSDLSYRRRYIMLFFKEPY